MFDIGFGELFLIAVVALLVLGPERLPRAARFAGLWMRKARAQWYSVKSEFENDLAADELKRSLAETRDSLRQAEAQIREGASSVRERMQKEFDDVSAAATGALVPASESGLEPGATTEQDATAGDAHAAQEPAHQGAHQLDRDENERSLESASHMDWEPPPPSDDDDGEPDPNFRHDADADAHASHPADADQPMPPKHTDDAHAGR